MLERLNKKDAIAYAKSIALIIIGTLILAFGTAVFIIPFDLVVGGVSGIGIIISRFIPSEIMSVELIISVLTWLAFLLGLFILGKSFALKTLVSAVVYPIGLSLFSILNSPDFFSGFFVMNSDSALHLMVSAIFGGLTIGIGCAITFMGGGSTGGTDILGFIACKFFKRIKSSLAIGIIDGAVVLFGMIFIKEFVLSLLGILSVFITTICIDKIFVGSSKSFVAQIITKNYEEINAAVVKDIGRTTTMLSTVGGYSKKEGKMLIVSFTLHQYAELLNIINKYDKDAFVTIYVAHEINGEGWTR